MKHSSYYSEFVKLHQLELAELKNAVKAHNGIVTFTFEDAPIVLCSDKYSDESENMRIVKLSIDENDNLQIFGSPRYSSQINMVVNIEFGHVGFITDAIPEP